MKRILAAAGGILVVTAGITLARADSGTIGFSGAVVEPTCSVAASAAATATEGGATPAGQDHLSCGRTSADAGSSYTRNVLELNARAVAANRLLSYYAGYAGSNGEGRVKLVVRTYD